MFYIFKILFLVNNLYFACEFVNRFGTWPCCYCCRFGTGPGCYYCRFGTGPGCYYSRFGTGPCCHYCRFGTGPCCYYCRFGTGPCFYYCIYCDNEPTTEIIYELRCRFYVFISCSFCITCNTHTLIE